MDHRQGIIVFGVLAIVGARLVMTGKLKKAVSAAYGQSSGPFNDVSAAASSAMQSSSPSDASGVNFGPNNTPGPNSGAFGFKPTSTIVQTQFLGKDASVQSDVSGEYNLFTPPDTPVYLPKGATYQLEKQAYQSGLPSYQQWEITSGPHKGGIFTFLHQLVLGAFKTGQTVQGGTEVGLSGYPESPQFAVAGKTGPTNAHLAVIVDPKSDQFLHLMGGWS